MPLIHTPAGDREAAQMTLADFSGARSPHGALAGFLLFFGCWREAHEVCQDDSSQEGSHWHAMVHRQEPDPGNAAYWFARAGLPSLPVTIDQQHEEWKDLFFRCAAPKA